MVIKKFKILFGSIYSFLKNYHVVNKIYIYNNHI